MVTAQSNDQITVIIDETPVKIERQQPILIDGVLLLPVRAIFEEMGFNVHWGDANRRVVLSDNRDFVVLEIGQHMFTINSETHTLDVPPQIVNDTTMMTICAILERIDYALEWDADTNTARIFRPEMYPPYIIFGGRRYSTDTRDFAVFGGTHEEMAQLRYMTNLRTLDLFADSIYVLSHMTELPNFQNLMVFGSIDDFTLLENLPNLRVLGLLDEEMNDLTPLANLTNLEYLSVFGGQIDDLSPLAELTNLRELEVMGSGFSDVAPLANLTKLEMLGLHGGEISDISPLTKLENLWKLHLEGNNISDITPIASLPQLGDLCVWNNQINDISPIAHLTDLIMLILRGNQIEDLTPLSGLTRLLLLYLCDNPISDLTPLSDLPDGISMTLRGYHRVTDWSPIAHFSWINSRRPSYFIDNPMESEQESDAPIIPLPLSE